MNSYDPLHAADDFAAENWQKPWRCSSAGDNCVEVNRSPEGAVGVRDSKLPESPVLVFTSAEWNEFLGSARAGQYDC
jgi:hypothetical protein